MIQSDFSIIKTRYCIAPKGSMLDDSFLRNGVTYLFDSGGKYSNETELRGLRFPSGLLIEYTYDVISRKPHEVIRTINKIQYNDTI